MPQESNVHPVALSLGTPLPDAVDTCAPFPLCVAVETASGADLSGAPYNVLEAGTIIAEGRLPPVSRADPNSHEYDPRHGPVDTRPTATIMLTAPARIGAARWTLVVPAVEIDGIAHAAASLTLELRTKAHDARLIIWDVGTPVVAGELFSFKVGAKCSACCALAGSGIELFDHNGELVATGILGKARWPGTEATYWTELRVRAPSEPWRFRWLARFAEAGLSRKHNHTCAQLRFSTIADPAHRVSITLLDKDSGMPVGDAMVRLGVYRKPTDENGTVAFDVPSGEHTLFVSKAGYEVPQRTLAVDVDLDIPVPAEMVPPEDPYARWTG